MATKKLGTDLGISTFTDKFKDGLRPNLFYVQLQSYSGNSNSKINLESLGLKDFNFFCKSATMPASTIGSVEIPFMGRSIKVAGNRTFEDWTVTVYNAVLDGAEGNSPSNLLRTPFESWMSYINSHNTNIGYNRIDSYKLDAIIKHLDQRGNCVAAYKMIGIFPTEVSSIDLAWDSNDTIEEFTVTFALGEYWALSPSDTSVSNSNANDYKDFKGEGA